MKICIDNGHGVDTAGKRSPDGRLREYEWARDIAREVARQLRERGGDVRLVTPEDKDVVLSLRTKRVNDLCTLYGAGNVVLVSIHVNAAGMGDKWHEAKGWSAYTSRGKTRSDDLATLLYAEAEKRFAGRKIRKDMSDGDPDWEENFYLLKHTACPAVLTENFFQDNRDDVDFLLSDEGKAAVVAVHVEALAKYAGL